MNYRDDNCEECRHTAGGDCGGHGPLPLVVLDEAEMAALREWYGKAGYWFEASGDEERMYRPDGTLALVVKKAIGAVE